MAETVPVASGSRSDGHDAAAAHAGTEHAEPLFLGIAPPMAIVSSSMLVLVAIALWKGVPKLLTGGLDAKIAEIKSQLAEAKSLRAQAEALRQEYADKIAGAEQDAAAMIDHARHEADAIVAKAETDARELIARREKMAEDRIGTAERTAIAELRVQAAAAAAAAAKGLIVSNYSAAVDRNLVDRSIGSL